MRYLTAGAGTVMTGAGWVTHSKTRAARWMRRLAQDAHRPVQSAPAKPTPNLWSDNNVTLAWLGHSTVLLNFYGIHILTDPALCSRVGISAGLTTLGPKRYIAPALHLRELPRIDVLLLSHAHMDHMDLPTLRCFPSSTFTVSAKATQDVLARARRKQVTELAWNERTVFRAPAGELEIQAVEVKHWGARWPSERPRGYNGYILRREGRSVLFGGDTARTEALARLRSQGPYDVALMPIGAYRPWIWNHCSPEEALAMANAARAQYVLPIHHQTFRLSDEPMNEPIQRLEAALDREPERLAVRRVGETFILPKTA